MSSYSPLFLSSPLTVLPALTLPGGGSGGFSKMKPKSQAMNARIELLPTQRGLHQFTIHSADQVHIGDSIEAPADYLLEQIQIITGEYMGLPVYELEEEPESFPCWKQLSECVDEFHELCEYQLIYFDEHGQDCFHTEVVDHEDLLHSLVWVLQNEMSGAILDYE